MKMLKDRRNNFKEIFGYGPLSIILSILGIPSILSLASDISGQQGKQSSIGLFFRKLRLLRRIKKTKRKKAREKRKAEKRFKRRRRWKIIRLIYKKTIEKYFQPDKSEMERRRAWKEEKRWIREEYKWNRRKRYRLIRFIIKRNFRKLFEPKGEDDIKKAQLRAMSRAQRRKRLLRLTRFVIKKRIQYTIIYLKNFPNQPIRPAHQLFVTSKLSKDQFLVIVLNSTAYFILAYLIMYMLSQMTTALIGLHFDYQTIFYYYKLYFNIVTSQWSADSVKILFSMPSLVSIFLAVILLIFYNWVQNENGTLKMLVLWMVFYGITYFFGSLLIGSILDQGFGYVAMYLYYMDTERMTIVFFTVFMLLVGGVILTKSFMICANSYFNDLSEHNRPAFMIAHVLLPYLLGTGIILLTKLPEISAYETFILLSGILVILPVMATFKTYNELYFDLEPRKISLSSIAVVLSIILFAAFRIVFSFDILRIG